MATRASVVTHYRSMATRAVYSLQLKKHGYLGSVVILSTVKEAWLPGQRGNIVYSYYLDSVVTLSTVKEAWLPWQCGHIVYS